MCRLCGLDNETIDHIIFDQMTLTDKRLKLFGVQSPADFSQEGLLSRLVDSSNRLN